MGTPGREASPAAFAGLHVGLPPFGCIARPSMNVEVNRNDAGLPQGAVQPLPAETRGDDVAEGVELDSRDQAGQTPQVNDARVIVDFAVGSSGVGPVMGFGSDDFFPYAPDADAVPDNSRTEETS